MSDTVQKPFATCDGLRLRPFTPADRPLVAGLVAQAASSGSVWAAIGGDFGPVALLRGGFLALWALPAVLTGSGSVAMFTNFDADPGSRRCSVAPLFGHLPVHIRPQALLLYARALVLAHPINKIDVLVDGADAVLTEVLARAGFVKEATRQRVELRPGRPVNVSTYGLLRSELDPALAAFRLPDVPGEGR